MKVIASITILASACSAFNANQATKTANAVSRRNFFSGVTSAAIATAVTVAQPFPAMAKGSSAPLPPINGIYSDPNHKKGYRIVRAVDRSNAVITLQDEPNSPVITIPGKIKTSKKTGTTIALDFSSKGGPKDITATLTDNQLVFSDGNAWTQSPGADGIYADPNHPTGYRALRIKGSKVFITAQDDPKGEVVELVGKSKGKGSLVIDFSPKGGPKNLAATVSEGKLVFPDGNSWTKKL